ncbi:MAG TPA: hypothetical protein VN903_23490 [Polyangia bacterium]|nr:hypothetical protein [Polyangia bacterium]
MSRRIRVAVLGLIAAALSCGGGKSNGGTGGAAGSSAAGRGGGAGANVGGSGGNPGSSGGNAGGGGDAGSGGGDGGATGAWACTTCRIGTSLWIEGSIIGAGNQPVSANVAAAITVSSIAIVSVFDGVETQIIMASTASSERWTWTLRIPNLPADLIKMGDSFDLTVAATSTSQTVVLSRGGALVAFTASLSQDPLSVPALDAWGISVADERVLCEDANLPCGRRAHVARITSGGESAMVVPDQTVTLHDLSFSVNRFEEIFSGGCGLPSFTMMGGFRQPAGAGGAGGAAGTGGGSGGQGGALSSYPACTGGGPCTAAGGLILDASERAVMTSLTATVMVSAVDRGPTSNNNRIKVTLADTASTQTWVWSPAIPNLPANRLNVGDRFDLNVDASACPFPGTGACQTVVLSRAGALIAFTVDLQSANMPVPTALAPWGISVGDAGAVCGFASASCAQIQHNARVTVGSETTQLAPYQTATVQGVSISVADFNAVTRIACDLPATTRFAGFRLP